MEKGYVEKGKYFRRKVYEGVSFCIKVASKRAWSLSASNLYPLESRPYFLGSVRNNFSPESCSAKVVSLNI